MGFSYVCTIEFMEALNLPPSTTTTAITSLPNTGITPSSGSCYSTTLQQTSNNSSVRVVSTPVVSSIPTVSQHNQGLLIDEHVMLLKYCMYMSMIVNSQAFVLHK